MRFGALICLLLAGCASSPDSGAAAPSPRAHLDEEFTLALGDSIPLDGTPYSVVFEKVLEDSRCPIGTTCVWEGNARIQILLREWDGHQEPGGKQIVEVLDSTLELNSNPKMPNEKNGTGYVVELRRLEPMPREGAPTSNYVATLLARKP